jgi:hypothetical protein
MPRLRCNRHLLLLLPVLLCLAGFMLLPRQRLLQELLLELHLLLQQWLIVPAEAGRPRTPYGLLLADLQQLLPLVLLPPLLHMLLLPLLLQ